MSDITVNKIVLEYLKNNGYDGLFCEDSCACDIADFQPCGECICGCLPGYKVPCDGTCDYGEQCDFHIVEERPKTNETT